MSGLKSLQKLTAGDLKQLCREAKMKVGGTKLELAMRLCGMEEENTAMSTRAVNNWLKKQGIDDVKRVSRCLRAGIHMGYVDITGDTPLDNVVISDSCYMCDHELDVTIRDLLYQRDYAGDDYESGGLKAAIKCPNKECEITGMYVTSVCTDSPYIDSGKEHNHCHDCPGFGICTSDYRLTHCEDCGKHYHLRFSCYCESDDSESELDDEYGMIIN